MHLGKGNSGHITEIEEDSPREKERSQVLATATATATATTTTTTTTTTTSTTPSESNLTTSNDNTVCLFKKKLDEDEIQLRVLQNDQMVTDEERPIVPAIIFDLSTTPPAPSTPATAPTTPNGPRDVDIDVNVDVDVGKDENGAFELVLRELQANTSGVSFQKSDIPGASDAPLSPDEITLLVTKLSFLSNNLEDAFEKVKNEHEKKLQKFTEQRQEDENVVKEMRKRLDAREHSLNNVKIMQEGEKQTLAVLNNPKTKTLLLESTELGKHIKQLYAGTHQITLYDLKQTLEKDKLKAEIEKDIQQMQEDREQLRKDIEAQKKQKELLNSELARLRLNPPPYPFGTLNTLMGHTFPSQQSPFTFSSSQPPPFSFSPSHGHGGVPYSFASPYASNNKNNQLSNKKNKTNNSNKQ